MHLLPPPSEKLIGYHWIHLSGWATEALTIATSLLRYVSFGGWGLILFGPWCLVWGGKYLGLFRTYHLTPSSWCQNTRRGWNLPFQSVCSCLYPIIRELVGQSFFALMPNQTYLSGKNGGRGSSRFFGTLVHITVESSCVETRRWRHAYFSWSLIPMYAFWHWLVLLSF